MTQQQVEHAKRYIAAIKDLTDSLGRPPTVSELAAKVGDVPSIAAYTVRRLRSAGIINQPTRRYARGVSVADHCPLCGCTPAECP